MRWSDRARGQHAFAMTAEQRRSDVRSWHSREHDSSSFDSRRESLVNRCARWVAACLRVARGRFRTDHFENPSTFAAFHRAAGLLEVAPFYVLLPMLSLGQQG